MTYDILLDSSFGLVKSYNMPCTVESASLEPKFGNKFIAGGEDMWVHVFDFHTGDEIGMCSKTIILLNEFYWGNKTCYLAIST